jgi:hypothetical protein
MQASHQLEAPVTLVVKYSAPFETIQQELEGCLKKVLFQNPLNSKTVSENVLVISRCGLF